MAPEHPIDGVEEAAPVSAPEESAPEESAAEESAPAESAPAEAGNEEAAPAEAAESAAEPEPAAEKPAPVADEVLLASVDLARAALLEIAPAATIGDVIGSIADDEHVLSLHFESKLAGYPGWHWTVTLARVDESSEPTVLEIEMLPGENALIAPDWVPWSERLAEYTLAQELAEATAAADGDESDDDDLDEDDDDHDLDDSLDLDNGIDIDDHVTDDDELEAAAHESGDDADDESDDDESDDDDDDDDESDDEYDDDPHAEGPWSGR